MTLLQRTLPSLLCCVIAFGYAPAWLHVSVCQNHHEAALDGAQVGASCTHSCGHSHNDVKRIEGNGALPDPNDQPSEHGHDSETCFVCQSLGNANGLASQWEMQLQSTRLCEPVFITGEFHLVQTALLIANPRGPPVRV